MKPWFGLHLPLYTYPGASSAELFDRVVEQAQAADANNTHYRSVEEIALVAEALGLVGG